MSQGPGDAGKHEPSRWVVCRQDDHGNVFEVQRGLSEDDALSLVAELESHGHKQRYWATHDEAPCYPAPGPD